jgi:hypothetical protein
MISAFLFIALFALLLSFGYFVSVRILKLSDALSISGMTIILGTSVFIVFLNAFTYLMPFSSACILTVAIITLVTAWIFISSKTHTDMIKPPRWLTVTILIFALVTGFAFMRILPSDVLHWTQAPTISTIVEGNFPVMQATNPWNQSNYHYGPELLVAAERVLAGVRSEVGYALQPLLGIAAILCFVASLLFILTKSWKSALWGSVLAIAGTGFAWFNGIDLIRDVYQHFILNEAVHGPFKALWPMQKNHITNAILVIFMHRSSALGFPIFFGMIFSLYKLFNETSRAMQIRWILLCILLSLALLLTMETGFVVILVSLFLFILVQPILKNDWKRIAKLSAFVMIPSLLIGLVQGGVLMQIGPGESLGLLYFKFTGNVQPNLSEPIAIWSMDVIMSFGLPLFLFPFAIWHLKKRRAPSFVWFIVLMGIVCLFTPAFVQFYPRRGEMLRLFWIATSLFSMLAGIYISQTALQSSKKYLQLLGYTAITCMLISSSIGVGMNLLFPTKHFESAPVFAHLPEMTKHETAFYNWIKENTTQDDYFYTLSANDGDDHYMQGLFIERSGRFSIGHIMGDTLSTGDPALNAIKNSCDASAFRELSIRYIAISQPEHAEWFKKTCNASDWILRYDSGGEDLRVYESRFSIPTYR